MTTFKRHRNEKELAAECKKRDYSLKTDKYEEGSDYVSFNFYPKGSCFTGNCMVNLFNGKFFGKYMGKNFSSDDDKDHLKWFKELLEIIYIK